MWIISPSPGGLLEGLAVSSRFKGAGAMTDSQQDAMPGRSHGGTSGRAIIEIRVIEEAPGMSQHQINRRGHERFTLPPMHSGVTVVRAGDDVGEEMTGHAYDVSEGGIRFELDQALEPGESVTLGLDLPGDGTVGVSGRVVWLTQGEDDPGPRRMALAIDSYVTDGDRVRLVRYLGNGGLRRAA